MRILWLILFGSFAAVCAGVGGSFKFAAQTLTVPDGFTIEQIAGLEQVERPISADFDEQGRLYVTDSSGSNEKVDLQLAEKPHRIVRLEDADGDGRFDKQTVFADKMMFPEGCLWHQRSLYVSAPPSIWKLTDTNDDGVADVRVEWHKGQTLTGCANDLHGPYLGLDGMMYWCKGAFAFQTNILADKSLFISRAAHIFRAWPDYSGLEPVLTGGMDNPVAVAFTPEGERILCGTFFVIHEPGHRDGLIHAIYGGVYGKQNEATDGHPRTGDLMPIMTHLGPAAPCSVIRYASASFGPSFENNLFVCSFNLHKVTRHILQPNGATYTTTDSDFVTSDNPDFHPTCVLEDADGSLILLDTGGWYKICCPTSQLSKPDVLGAVYRIRRQGVERPSDPRGLKLEWQHASADDLARRVLDSRLGVRQRAMTALAQLGENSVGPLKKLLASKPSPAGRLNIVWTLARIDSEEARAVTRDFAKDHDQAVRHAALSFISLWRDEKATDALNLALKNPEASLRRVAAEAMGRLKKPDFIPALLQAATTAPDRVLEHSIIYALIEIADEPTTLAGLRLKDSGARRAALMALDQMHAAQLKGSDVASLLNASATPLAQAANWVASHHPEWGPELAGYFAARLHDRYLAEPQKHELAEQMANFGGNQAIQQLVSSSFGNQADEHEQALLLRIIQLSQPRPFPESWVASIEHCLNGTNAYVTAAAVAAAKAVPPARLSKPDLAEPLLRIAGNSQHAATLRLDALGTVPPGRRKIDPSVFDFLLGAVAPEKPVAERASAATILSKTPLSDAQLNQLAAALPGAGPLELSRLVNAYEHSHTPAIGEHLIDSLKQAKSVASLRPELIKNVLTNYPPEVQAHASDLLQLVNADAEKQNAHLEELLGKVKSGDIRRGQAVFNSAKAACSSCHAIGYLGGHVGPDLTNIGKVRTERDLLESIVYPSASFVRSFEPYVVNTRGDESYSGVIKKDGADELVLATGPNTEVRIARSDITDMRPSTVSVMPSGLEGQLSIQELSDLLAFLQATRWGAQ